MLKILKRTGNARANVVQLAHCKSRLCMSVNICQVSLIKKICHIYYSLYKLSVKATLYIRLKLNYTSRCMIICPKITNAKIY